MRRSSRIVGRTRIRLAEKLKEEFAKMGVEVRIDPKLLRAAQGRWRTDFRADVYRWEGSFEKQLEDGSWAQQTISSWDTMTDCAKGLEIYNEDRPWWWDVSALTSRTPPIIARLKQRPN